MITMCQEDFETSAAVVVSPLPKEHLDWLWKLCLDFSALMIDDHSPKNLAEAEQMHANQLANGSKQYGFLRDDQPVGVVWFDFAGDGMYLGHLVFEKELSTKEKLAMTHIAIARLFDDGARKIIWQMFADNEPFKRFLNHLGAHFEGLLREGTRRNGELRDVMLMASFARDKR